MEMTQLCPPKKTSFVTVSAQQLLLADYLVNQERKQEIGAKNSYKIGNAKAAIGISKQSR